MGKSKRMKKWGGAYDQNAVTQGNYDANTQPMQPGQGQMQGQMQPQPLMQPGQGQMQPQMQPQIQPPQDKGIVDTATNSVKNVSNSVTGFLSNWFGSETPAPVTGQPGTGQPGTGQSETKQDGGRRRKRSHKKRSHKKRSRRSKRSRRHR